MAGHTCIVGLGDVGRRVALRLLERGERVSAVTRRAIEEPDIATQVVDLDHDSPGSPIEADAILYTVAPQPRGDDDQRLRRFLDSQPCCRRLVYISTTGVYGDCGGGWVSEAALPHPQTARARRRLAAETLLDRYASERSIELAILRVPGIYGPGRLPLERLREGTPVLKIADSPWSNRIHADDLAQACVLACLHGRGVYNVSDGRPTPMSEYFLTCARILGLPAPPQVDWATAERVLSPAMLSFLSESRRLNISRARTDLGYTPRYPDLADGIRASLGGAHASARSTNQ